MRAVTRLAARRRARSTAPFWPWWLPPLRPI
jgi:hypothetical protein